MNNPWDWFCNLCTKKIPIRKLKGFDRTDGYVSGKKHYCKECYEEVKEKELHAPHGSEMESNDYEELPCQTSK